ncbi:homoserine kinase [Variovorax sp. PAMC28562]|uniref:homoserine kinase n=1 Tax=Variovorax sp. PAMC28562 TaxID=2762323 RepID=UPI00164EC175|nr:homoserine kinase [Variovorax sp. PAMC28562]QNK71953.1 homoserine kinase [Variovorax sp. PAMC28562]
MAVFTEVGFDPADELVRRLGLGALRELRGIEGGIENTNYFATTEQGEYVLTVFERLGFQQLPYYLCLMKHLAERGIPVPAPAADPTVVSGAIGVVAALGAQAKTQALKVPSIAPCALLHTLNGKPAAVVQRLSGKSELAPTAAHCAELGHMLARMHLAGRDFDRLQPNLRGLAWWNDTAPVVLPYLEASQAALLRGELAYQNHVAESSSYAALPRGPVHADLFRDNAMFATGVDGECSDGEFSDGPGSAPRLTGIFDFYFAGTDTWLFDLAVCLNDWAIDLPTGEHDAARADALLAAYATVRPLTGPERALLPALLRAAALRFWISRLWDYHLPRAASMLKPHDPTHFERVLRQRARHPDALQMPISAADPTPALIPIFTSVEAPATAQTAAATA